MAGFGWLLGSTKRLRNFPQLLLSLPLGLPLCLYFLHLLLEFFPFGSCLEGVFSAFVFSVSWLESGVLIHTCCPCSWEAEAEES